MIDQYFGSLQYNLRNPIRTHAKRTVIAYATWCRADEKYEREANNPSFIPTDCKFKFQLQPSARVEATQEFKECAEETQRIVVECREKLKKQHMKCTLMNVKQLKTDITESFAKSLPKTVELLYAVEKIQGVSVHTAVANLLAHNRDDAISFLNVTDNEFKDAYLKANGLNTFPSPSDPPIITVAAAAPTGVLTLRGGNDGQANNSTGRTPTGQRIQLRYGGSAFNVNQPTTATAPQGRGRGVINAQSVTPNNLGFQPASEVLRQQQLLQGANNQLQIFDYGNEADQSNNMAELQQQSQQSVQQQQGPAQQQQQQQGQQNNPPVQNDVNQGQDSGGNNNNTANDEVMADAVDQQGVNGNNNGNGGQNDNAPQGGQNQAPPAAPATATAAALDATTIGKLNKVHRRLLDIIDQAFINPRNKYDQQKEANDTDARIFKVANRQEIQEEADNVAAAIAAQPAIDPSILKIVIKDTLDEVEAKKQEAAKKQQQQKGTSTKNNQRGPTVRGRLANKKKSPTPKSKSPSGDGAAAKSNATGGGSRQGGRPSGARKSSQKNRPSNTKSNKSRGASKKK
jgi:hypothetical protein